MLSFLLLFTVLALSVYGQLMMKARALVHASASAEASGKLQYLIAMLTDIGVLSAFAAAVPAAVCWMLVIERIDVGYALPFVALTFVLVPIGSTLLFGEPLPPIQLAGLALIVAGVTISALAR
jgi:multidrug transporter EmrE-like cation transporter